MSQSLAVAQTLAQTPEQPQELAPTRGRRVGRREWPWWVAQLPALAALAVVGVLRAVNLSRYPGFANDDEGTYYAQAMAFWQHGELAHYSYWYDHPPLGWIQVAPLLALLSAVTPDDVSAITIARIAMVPFAVVTAALIYLLARQLGMGRWPAVVALLVWGISPLAVVESRPLFLDNIAVPWLLASFALALNRRRDMYLHVAAGAAFAVAILTKETMVLALPALVLVLSQRTSRRVRAFSLVGFLTTMGLVGLAYPLLAATRSELLPGQGHVSLWEGIAWQLGDREGSGWAFETGTIANVTVDRWAYFDLPLLVGGLLAAVACLFVARLRWVGVLVLTFTLIGLRPSGYLPRMYDVVLLPFLALAAVAVVHALGRRLVASRRVRLVLGTVTVGAVTAALVPVWGDPYQVMLNRDDNANYREAIDWVQVNVPEDAVVITDSDMWADLVRDGRPDDGWSGPVWFYKYAFDLEGRSKAGIDGWQDVDYIIATPVVNAEADERIAALGELYQHSTVVKSFGESFAIRKVDPASQGVGPVSPAPTGDAGPPASSAAPLALDGLSR